MDIWLIRHTSVAIGPSYCYGRSDVELADTFHAEAAAVRAKIVSQGSLDALAPVITSPAQRCKKLAVSLGGQVSEDEDLWEMNFGSWEGQKWGDIPRAAIDSWAKDLGNVAPPGGETLTEVSLRAQRAWERLMQLGAETVYCVTHAGIIRVLLAHLFEMPTGRAFSLAVDYGGCSLVQVSDLPPKLKKFNL